MSARRSSRRPSQTNRRPSQIALAIAPGSSGKLEPNLNRARQDGVRILERTPKSEGCGAAGESSWRTFGAPRPVLNPGLTQRDMQREDHHAADPEPSAGDYPSHS